MSTSTSTSSTNAPEQLRAGSVQDGALKKELSIISDSHNDFIMAIVAVYFATSIWDNLHRNIARKFGQVVSDSIHKGRDLSLERTDALIVVGEKVIKYYQIMALWLRKLYTFLSLFFACLGLLALYFSPSLYPPKYNGFFFIPLAVLFLGNFTLFFIFSAIFNTISVIERISHRLFKDRKIEKEAKEKSTALDSALKNAPRLVPPPQGCKDSSQQARAQN